MTGIRGKVLYSVFHNEVKQSPETDCIRIARQTAWGLCRQNGGTARIEQDGRAVATFAAVEFGVSVWRVEERA